MKNVIKVLIVSLIIPIIIAFFNFCLNRQKVDVRYTLSENIPISVSNQSSSENVQQLVVKNLGNLKAERIVVNIQGKIINYNLIKYSEIDKEQSFNKSDGLQIIYPELPPQGSFKIIVKSQGKGIATGDVKISHNKGNAIEALSSENSKSSWAILVIVFMYVLFVIYMIIGILIDSLQRKARYGIECIKVLNRKEPFYLSKEKWNEIRKSALETKFHADDNLYEDIENSNYYKMLSNDKPDYLRESEWEELLKKYCEILETSIGNKVKNIFCKTDTVIKILKLKRPKQLSENKWHDIRKEILERMEALIQYNNYYNQDREIEELEIYKLLCSDRPDYISENEWEEQIENCSKALEISIGNKVKNIFYGTNDIIKILKLERPKQLSENKWHNIRKEVLKKEQILLQDNNYYIQNKAIEEFEIYMLLDSGKPDYLNTNEWNDFSPKLIDILENVILKRVSKISSYNEILNFLRIERPREYSLTRWNELMRRISDKYIVLKKQNIIVYKLYADNEKLIEELKGERVGEVPIEFWDEYIKYMKKIYYFNVLYNIYNDKSPIEFFNNQLTEYLDESRQLKEEAYSVQLTNYYMESLNEEYQQFITSEMPSWITKKDYNKISQYLEDKHKLNMLISENRKASQMIQEESSNVRELKDKITYQLDIINEVLVNPSVIDRIEDYNNKFSRGNFENLKKIAEIIKDNKALV